MTRLTDAYLNAIAKGMAPSLDRAGTCRATGNHLSAQNDEPEPEPQPCPRGADKPEETCTNRHQCWEPCGELGHSEEHVKVYRGPLPDVSELSEEEAAALIPIESATEYALRKARENVRQAAALDQQHFDNLRRIGRI